MTEEKYKKGLRRNLSEITFAKNMLQAYKDLWSENPKIYPYEFLGQCSFALFNDMLSHLMKVFDFNSQSITFKDIYDFRKDRIDEKLLNKNYNLKFIEKISKKLRLIRDKTHFHIDSKSVIDTKAVWKEADIKWKDIELIIKILSEILLELYSEDVSELQPFVNYYEPNISKIIKQIQENKK